MNIFKKKADMTENKDKKTDADVEAALKGKGQSGSEGNTMATPASDKSVEGEKVSTTQAAANTVMIDRQEYEDFKEKAAELLASKDNLLRTVAEFENTKKRIERQKDEFITYANKKIIFEFLPIMDNLTRAIESAKANHSVDSMIAGVDLINKQLQDILKGHGLERITSVGKVFDPHKHEAIGTVPSDVYAEDIVVEEITPGYMYKDTLLRAAVVRVSSGKHGAAANDDDDGEQD